MGRAAVVLPCRVLDDELLDFFREHAGLRVASIFPADNPRTALLVGREGLNVQLERSDAPGSPGLLALTSSDVTEEVVFTAPNGTQVAALLMAQKAHSL